MYSEAKRKLKRNKIKSQILISFLFLAPIICLISYLSLDSKAWIVSLLMILASFLAEEEIKKTKEQSFNICKNLIK